MARASGAARKSSGKSRADRIKRLERLIASAPRDVAERQTAEIVRAAARAATITDAGLAAGTPEAWAWLRSADGRRATVVNVKMIKAAMLVGGPDTAQRILDRTFSLAAEKGGRHSDHRTVACWCGLSDPRVLERAMVEYLATLQRQLRDELSKGGK